MKLTSALRFRNFRIFIFGQAFSSIGFNMQMVAMSWLAYQLTESIFVLSIVTFANPMAAFFTGLFAGVVADKFNKKKIIQIARLMIAITSLILVVMIWTEQVTITFLICVQLFMGLMDGMEMPTKQALVNNIVSDKKYLMNAIALNSTVFNTARVLGPGIAGLLIPVVGEAMCFLIYGILSLFIVVTLVFVKTYEEKNPDTRMNFRAEFSEGMRYAFGFPKIRLSILYAGAFTLLGVSFIVLLPLLAGEIFSAGAKVFGYMNSALGLGAIIGAIFLANRSTAEGIQRFIFYGTAVFSISLILVSFSNVLILTLIAIAFTGLGRTVVFIGTNTLLQTIAQEGKRGRVLSLYISMFMVSMTVGGLLVGALADWIGVMPTILLEGCACLGLCFIYKKQVKHIESKKEEETIDEKELIMEHAE